MLPANALTTAVGEEIRNYPGVRAVTAYLVGDPDQPELHAIITLAADADVPGIRRRIVSEAVAHARMTLDAPECRLRSWWPWPGPVEIAVTTSDPDCRPSKRTSGCRVVSALQGYETPHSCETSNHARALRT